MFNRDILLIDTEATGLDLAKHELIQLAGVLLDKKTLKEKKSFNSYIKPVNWKLRDPAAMKVNRLTWSDLKHAPSAKQVIKKFDRAFPHQVILAYYGGPLDMDFLRRLYKKIGKRQPFDYHFFNIWGLFYAYLARRKKLNNRRRFTGFTLENLMERFNISSPGRHDALTDCRIEAEILRRVMKDL